MNSARQTVLSPLCLILLAAAPHAKAADWPQWRGPARTGHIATAEVALEKLPAEPKTVWRLKVGEGLASPVVARGQVFYFDAVAGKETLHAIDATTSREIWRATIDDAFADTQGPAGPRCTPVVDEDQVYAVSCKGELQCLSSADGKILWRVNYAKDFQAEFTGETGPASGAARHGNNGSPLIVGDRLYACVGGTNGAGVVAFDKYTGRVLWKSQNDQAAFAPPVFATLANAEQVVAYTVDGLIGLRPDNGQLLWRLPVKTRFGRHVTTPVFVDDTVVIASHQAGMIGTRISFDGPGFKTEQAWLNREQAVNFSSPVLVGKHLYGLGAAKDFICVDVLTGKLMWSKTGHITTSADKSHASFIALGKNILALTDSGEVVLFAADPAGFHEMGRAQVCGVNWCNPAYADGRLYVRDGIKTTGELFCFSLIP